MISSKKSVAWSLLAAALWIACGGEAPLGPLTLEEVEGPYTWGSVENVTHLGHLWLSAQPDEAALEAAKAAGVTVVLDLRAPGEREWNEADAVRGLGLDYHTIPVPGDQPFSETAFAEIEELVRSRPEDEILIHCSSGNRAAAWLTTHLVQQHGMTLGDALAVGRRTGITKRAIVEKTASYLGEAPPEPPTAAPASKGAERAALRERATQLFGVLPDEVPNDSNPITEAKVRLGRMLYYDTRLSKNHDISCNSCHALDRFGVDNEPTSPGHRGQRGERNSPTVYNAALHTAQFWDGRAADVEEQAMGPILNPVEMAMAGGGDAVEIVKSIPGYGPLFAEAFPDDEDPISFEQIAQAIAAFERRLMTPSRFDAFMSGDVDALQDEEVEGLQAFLDAGCITCHMGPGLGGQLFQKLGLVHPYETGDTGRHAVTGNEGDRYVFKVPALRNVAKTHPYFHDGSVAELPEAARLMAWHQLGRELSESDLRAIVAFLESLTGEPDAALIARPKLPESGPETPAPDPT